MKVRFTSKEDETIIRSIKKTPTNILSALERASAKLDNRSLGSVRQRYYSNLRHKHDILTTGSNAGFTRNSKNTPRKEGIMNMSLSPLHTVIEGVLNLNKADKALVIKLLNK